MASMIDDKVTWMSKISFENVTSVRISCTLPPLRYALTKNPVRSGTTM